jgi:photosystem II stability/assembly factor-like uncharacterized protein
MLIAAPVASAGVNHWTLTGPAGYDCRAVAFDPRDSDRIYAAAWGAILRSLDGGESWSLVVRTAAGFGDAVLEIDPQQPDNVYAMSSGTLLHRSTNAGDTWTTVSFSPQNPLVLSLAIDPANTSNLIAGTNGGLYRSVDRGNSWTLSVAASMYSLAIAPQDSSVIYGADLSAYYYYGFQQRPGQLYTSTNGGVSWNTRATPFGFHRDALAVDPANPSTLYAGSVGLFKSEDSGSTWTEKPLSPGTLVTHVVFDPRNSDTMYLSSYDGVFRSVDRGESWRRLGRGSPDQPMITVAIDSSGTRLLAIGWDSRVHAFQVYSGAWDLAAGAGSRTDLAFVNPHDVSKLEAVDGAGGSIGSSEYFLQGGAVAAIASGADLTWVLWNHEGGGTALQVVGSLQDYAFHRYYPVGDWTAVDIAASPDRTAAVLWTNPDGRSGIWRVDSYGTVSGSVAFGPFDGWTARRIAHGPDGRLRLLWTHTDGRVGISTIDGGQIVSTYRFTPEAGWSARDLTVATDGQARILMDGPDDAMTVWSVSDSGVQTEGPIHASPSAGQSASRLSAGSDGLTRVLWTSPEGVGTVYLMSLDGSLQGSFGLN